MGEIDDAELDYAHAQSLAARTYAHVLLDLLIDEATKKYVGMEDDEAIH